jgi:Sperm-tail PG-rich repeat
MKHSSVPAYTIAKKYPAEPITTDKLSPSPDTYNIRKEEIIVPARSFGRAPRSFSAPKSDEPGPGSYTIPNFLDTTMSKKSSKKSKISNDKSDKNKHITPGPASYNPQKLQTTIAHSMGNKTFNLISSDTSTLGPGQYDPNMDAIKPVKSNTIGRSNRSQIEPKLNVPGPGAYSLAEIKECPQYVFPKEPRGKRLIPDYPAPGEYNIPDLSEELKHKPGKSMLSRRPLPIKDSGAPGPGAYEVKMPKSTPSFSVGFGKRSDLGSKNKNPGPGEHNPIFVSENKKSSSIGKGKRPDLAKSNNIPGPGAYNSSSFIDEGPKFSMVGRKPEPKKITNPPGPGQYNSDINPTKPDSIHPVIGTGQRTNESRRGLKNFPGPGAYDPYVKSDSPKWTFKKDPKEKINFEDDPGPGQYDIPPTVPDVPKYLLNPKK